MADSYPAIEYVTSAPETALLEKGYENIKITPTHIDWHYIGVDDYRKYEIDYTVSKEGAIPSDDGPVDFDLSFDGEIAPFKILFLTDLETPSDSETPSDLKILSLSFGALVLGKNRKNIFFIDNKATNSSFQDRVLSLINFIISAMYPTYIGLKSEEVLYFLKDSPDSTLTSTKLVNFLLGNSDPPLPEPIPSSSKMGRGIIYIANQLFPIFQKGASFVNEKTKNNINDNFCEEHGHKLPWYLEEGLKLEVKHCFFEVFIHIM